MDQRIPGTISVAVTPCSANSARRPVRGCGFPANYLGTLDLGTGVVTAVDMGTQSVQPEALLLVHGHGNHCRDDQRGHYGQ